MNKSSRHLIVITGPTASGKTALAIETALRYNTEIISADSRQIYKGIPISTAMPSDEERMAVKHHFIDMLPLESYFSAAKFEEEALNLIEDRFFKKNDVAVVCGGSSMYIDALCNGIDLLPTVSEDLRATLKEAHERFGDRWLLDRLKALDPSYWRVVDKANIKRVFHAVEVSMQAGQPYRSLLTGKKKDRPFQIHKFHIEMPREELFERINTRVDRMIKAGLEEEARSVYDRRHLNSLNTVGLKEMFEWFDGRLNKATAISRIKKDTRVYAKKQLTWLRRAGDSTPLRPGEEILI